MPNSSKYTSTSKEVSRYSAESMGFFAHLLSIWQHRRLIQTLGFRDIRLRYTKTKLGFVWIIAQPLMAAAIFQLFFTKLFVFDVGLPEGIPFFLFAFIGFTGWLLFTNVMYGVGQALITEEQLIQKVAFPKIILLLSKGIQPILDFVVCNIVAGGIALLFFPIPIQWKILWWFPATLSIVCIGFVLGLWSSILSRKYRDVLHLLPFIGNFGIWLTPVFYSTELIPHAWRAYLQINPLVSYIEMLRLSFFGQAWVSYPAFFISLGILVLFGLMGIIYLYRVEHEFADAH
ncbi:MAG TPA: hypothetical protein DCF84_01705 [Bacteroidetes bacterium]|nr:hypothetical protein [Bacteroidota bacterium]